MSILSGVSDFFGLDIGSTAIRIVELRGPGPTKVLARYGYIDIDQKTSLSDSRSDELKLGQAVRDLVAESGITSRNVAVGIPSQRVFTTVVDIERLAPTELEKTIHYQADSLIPTPLADSKIDWALLGDSPADKSKVEILLSSVTNEFVERRLEMLESIGLNVIAFEPDGLALARATISPEATLPQMVIDMGQKNTDLVITIAGAPRLTRSIPTGSEALIKAAMQNLNIDENQAKQFVFKFGLANDKLEGQIHQAIIGTIDILTSEIDKSIKFFQSRYGGNTIDRIIVTGAASTLPEFPSLLANKFGVNIEIGNAWKNVSFSADRQNELTALSSQFSVAVGLAERSE